jgi:hypothetical protein
MPLMIESTARLPGSCCCRDIVSGDLMRLQQGISSSTRGDDAPAWIGT